MNIFKEAICYPFTKDGGHLLLFLAIFYLILDGLYIWNPSNFFLWIADWLLLGYTFAVFLEVIRHSASDSEGHVDFPQVGGIVDDIFVPGLKVVAAYTFGLLPFLVYTMLHLQWGDPSPVGEFVPLPEFEGEVWISGGLFALGIIYLPMCLLLSGAIGGLRAYNPILVFGTIFQTGWIYIPVLLTFVCFFVLESISRGFIIDWFSETRNPYLFLLISPISLYLLLVNGRLLGLLFLKREPGYTLL